MGRATGYEPLDQPKPFAPGIWVVDGPWIRFHGLPFPTRMSVVRLADGGLVVHSPVKFSKDLLERVEALGALRAFVAPNWIHYASLGDWQAARPGVETWAAPGVAERAAKMKVTVRVDRTFGAKAPDWAGELEPLLVTGSRVHREVVFMHHASRTLILTDLVENFEPATLPWWSGWLVRAMGMAAPDGRMPPDMYLTFGGHRDELRAHIRHMLNWAPERVILAHGLCYGADGAARLARAFRTALR